MKFSIKFNKLKNTWDVVCEYKTSNPDNLIASFHTKSDAACFIENMGPIININGGISLKNRSM